MKKTNKKVVEKTKDPKRVKAGKQAAKTKKKNNKAIDEVKQQMDAFFSKHKVYGF